MGSVGFRLTQFFKTDFSSLNFAIFGFYLTLDYAFIKLLLAHSLRVLIAPETDFILDLTLHSLDCRDAIYRVFK